MKTDYSDMLEKPHHESAVHPRLSMEQRAAQFMPFAALTGFSESIEITAEKTVSSVLEEEKGFENPFPPEDSIIDNTI